MFEANVDTGPIEAEMRALAAEMPELQKEALTVGIEWLFVASKRLLTSLIYNREIPRWRNGRPKWRRKMRRGGILGNETYSISTDGKTAKIFTKTGSGPAKSIKNYPGGYAQKQHDRSSPNQADWRTQSRQQEGENAVREARRVVQNGLARRR